jgi:hypothetical protein
MNIDFRTLTFPLVRIFTLLLLSLASQFAGAQFSPGMILRPSAVQPATAASPKTGWDVLDPDHSSTSVTISGTKYYYASSSTTGFTSTDDVSTSEIAYKPIPPYSLEPYGDLRRGANHKFSDYVPGVDNASYYMYYDGTNVLFRVRLGSIVPGAKGYSILIDTDGKFGNTGATADPNFIAATTGVNGNPGFEIEVVLATGGANDGILVYNVDGKDNPVLSSSFAGWTNYSQISMAATSDNGDPDYYLDYYLPFSALTALGVTTSTPLRMIPTTVMAPKAAIGGPKSDIYGLDDGLFKDANTEYMVLMNAMPSTAITNYGGTGTTAVLTAMCTAAPVINSPISSAAATVTITGTWTKNNITAAADNATIELFKDGVTTGLTTTVGTGGTFTFNNVAVVSGNVFTAKALGTSESRCYTSSSVVASNCAVSPFAPILSCSTGSKGTGGTNIQSGYTIHLKNMTTGAAEETATYNGLAATVGNFVFTANSAIWNWQGGCSGSPQGLVDGNYRIYYTNASGCNSDFVYYCVKNGSASVLTAPTVTTPTGGLTTINAGTKAIGGAVTSGYSVYLWVNKLMVDSVKTSSSAYSFPSSTAGLSMSTALNLRSGDSLYLVGYNNGSSTCAASVFTTKVLVSCYAAPPAITTNATTSLLSIGSPITGTSTEAAGTTIKVYAGANTLVATTTVATNGSWTTSGLYNAVASTSYYATATSGTCVSVNSGTAATGTAASTVRCGAITATTSTDASSYPSITAFTTGLSGTLNGSFNSTTVTVYEDGSSIGTTSTTGATWSISPVSIYTGGTLTLGIQESGKEEFTCPTTYAVTCTGPATPSLGFTSCTNCGGLESGVKSGSTVTYTATGIVSGVYYSLKDATTGKALSASQTATSASNLTFTTSVLTTTGTQNVVLVGTNFTNIGTVFSTCSSTSASRTVTVTSLKIGGTVWNDLNNSANGTFTSIYTAGEAAYAGATPYYVYLANGSGIVIDSAAVITSGSDKGTYSLKNVTGSLSGLSMYLSTTSIAIGSAVSGLSLATPSGYILTSPATRTGVSTSSSDQTGIDFGVQQFSVSGTVYNDANGTRNNLIDGTAIPGSVSATQLYVNLVNAANTTVLASAAVTASGTYTIGSSLVSGTTYNLVLTMGAATVGATLPAGWAATAEGVTGTGDASANGLYNFTMTSSALSGINFGIDYVPTANDHTAIGIPNPNGSATADVPGTNFSGSDGDIGGGGISYIHIMSFPTNVNGLYIEATATFGGAVSRTFYTASDFPGTGVYVPTTNSSTGAIAGTAIAIDPVDSAVTVAISYKTTDAAGKEAATAKTTFVPFTNEMVLPLRLLSFEAKAAGSAQALLTWTTASEVNTASFVIEHRTGTGTYETAGTIASVGQGAGTYRFTATSLAAGVHYFRLKMTDTDGRFTYSDVRSVRLSATEGTLTLAPNPVQSGFVTVRWNGNAAKATIRVVDYAGRVVYTTSTSANSLAIPTRGWAAGSYQVVLSTADTVMAGALIVK